MSDHPEFEKPDDLDLQWNTEPLCPECGNEHQYGLDLFGATDGDGATAEWECSCGAIVEVTLIIERSFSTELKAKASND